MKKPARLSADPELRRKIWPTVLQAIEYESKSQPPGEFNPMLVNYQKITSAILATIDEYLENQPEPEPIITTGPQPEKIGAQIGVDNTTPPGEVALYIGEAMRHLINFSIRHNKPIDPTSIKIRPGNLYTTPETLLRIIAYTQHTQDAATGWEQGVEYAHNQHNNHAGLSPDWKSKNPYRAGRP